uniref:Uncharacterized protein n=1 Tax=Haptolina brevifila TaxID=156173 RepID=A0A7S2GKB8_9EUKA|mmetsp:Transcript_37909/g.76028  ORF Transcript_37909/g.76028 Transcript_37909/m.76028 type:complete len:148 (+) Transcript_37909:619-1062(+)
MVPYDQSRQYGQPWSATPAQRHARQSGGSLQQPGQAPPQRLGQGPAYGETAHRIWAQARLAAAEAKLEVVQDVGMARLQLAEAKLGVVQVHAEQAHASEQPPGQEQQQAGWLGGMFDSLISSLWRPYNPSANPQSAALEPHDLRQRV